MYCPSCGSTNTDDQRFCRRCGMNLEAARQSLTEQFPGGREVDLTRREQRLERFGQFAFGGFGVVVLIGVAGIIYTILTKMVLVGEQPWAGLLLIAFILFAVLTLTYVVFNEDLKEKRKKARPSPPSELPEPSLTAKLLEEREFQPVATVVENTTELLPSRKDRR